ncbi:MAG: hypothetical protein JWN95_1710 [Frankiales bacterium]|nr:hypothetical protein [Frankiales bacterium]
MFEDDGVFNEDGAARDFADALPVQEVATDQFKPNQGGHVIVWTKSSGNWDAQISRRAGMSPDDQDSFDLWARDRVYRLIVSGTPELDGWFKRESDGGWQITARSAEGWVDPNG